MNERRPLVRAADFLMAAAFFLCLFASPFQALFYASLVLSAAARKFGARDVPGPRAARMPDLFLAVFLVTALTGALTARYRISSLEGLAVFAVYAVVYGLTRSYPMDERIYRRVSCAAGAGLLLAGGFALLHYFFIRAPIRFTVPFFGTLDFPATMNMGANNPLISILQNSSLGGNILAFLVTYLSGYLFGRARARDLKVREWAFYVPALLTGLTALVLTNTRGAMLFVLVSFVTLLVLYRKYVFLAVPVVLAAVILLLPNEKIRQTLRDPLDSPNMRGRFLQYRAGMEILLERNPFWGIGLRNFQYAYLENYSGEPEFERFPGGEIVTNGPPKKLLFLEEYRIENMPVPYIHNLYLSLVVETGVIGFLALMLFWIRTVLLGLRDFRRQNDPVAATTVAALAGFFANSLFDNLLYTVPFAVLLWWLTGLSRNRALKETWRTTQSYE